MHLIFYKSALCPRCHLAGKYLKEFVAKYPELEVKTVDVTLTPNQLWREGIPMIPALRIGEQTLSMVLPSRKHIQRFLHANGCPE